MGQPNPWTTLGQQQRRRSTARGSKCGQWRVVSRSTKLNADWLLLLGYWLCYINSTINPVCYALCNGNFRRTYWRIVTCRWSRISRPHRPHVAVGHRPHRPGGQGQDHFCKTSVPKTKTARLQTITQGKDRHWTLPRCQLPSNIVYTAHAIVILVMDTRRVKRCIIIIIITLT